MDVYAQIAAKIIERQEAIIGPVAIEQARQIANLQLDWPKREVSITGDKVHAINELVKIYENLFGRISVEVSREAAHSLVGQLKADQLPSSLR